MNTTTKERLVAILNEHQLGFTGHKQNKWRLSYYDGLFELHIDRGLIRVGTTDQVLSLARKYLKDDPILMASILGQDE